MFVNGLFYKKFKYLCEHHVRFDILQSSQQRRHFIPIRNFLYHESFSWQHSWTQFMLKHLPINVNPNTFMHLTIDIFFLVTKKISWIWIWVHRWYHEILFYFFLLGRHGFKISFFPWHKMQTIPRKFLCIHPWRR